MNYRHAFHAGNFADVLKHAVLTLVIAYLREKPAAFRVIDTHAGAGRYDLSGPEAQRPGEWRSGIARLAAATLPSPGQELVAAYLAAVAALNAGPKLTVYPGSPLLALSLMRPQDRLVACEREPGAAAQLISVLKRDRRARAVAIDGWTALTAYVPPNERRGVVLIDPPFEAPDEFTRMAQALLAAHRKWPGGTYMLWYPLKDLRESNAFARAIAHSGIAKVLRAELSVAPPDGQRLHGSGLLIVNPPWTLESQLEILLPALASVLGGDKGCSRLDWLAGEK